MPNDPTRTTRESLTRHLSADLTPSVLGGDGNMLELCGVSKRYGDFQAVQVVGPLRSPGEDLRVPGSEWCREDHHHSHDRRGSSPYRRANRDRRR